MPKLTVQEELDVALRSAAAGADSGSSSWQIAERFWDSDHDLLEPFIADWVMEKIALLIRKHRRFIKREQQPQLVLFEAEERSLGIGRIPKRLQRDKKKIIRQDAQLKDLEKLAAELAKRKLPALEDVRKSIALMRRHTRSHPRITWAEVVHLEAVKAAKKKQP